MKPKSSDLMASPTMVQLVRVGADVAAARGGVHEHHVHVPGDQRLHRRAEVVEQLEYAGSARPRPGCRRPPCRSPKCPAAPPSARGVRRSPAALRSGPQPRSSMNCCDVIVDVEKSTCCASLLGDRDAVHPDVELPCGNRRDHRVPRRVVPFHRTVSHNLRPSHRIPSPSPARSWGRGTGGACSRSPPPPAIAWPSRFGRLS